MELPRTVCFRVTRFCNARCGFCLAPPDGGRHPRAEVLLARIDWLLQRGVRTIHFCGGEPTIHAALPALLFHVHERGGKTKVTTNAIEMSAELLEAMRELDTEVKVSVHGDREHHDAIVGRTAFDATTTNLGRLLAADIRTTVQTTLVARNTWVVDWMSTYCLRAGVARLCFLPFIPRGSGRDRRDDYGLSSGARRMLKEHVSRARRAHAGRLEVRWLDFTARPIHVVEADGRLVLEGATEGLDEVLAVLPASQAG